MSNSVTGIVEAVSAKTETKAGKKLRSPMYSFKLDDGNWYGCGFDNPHINKGMTVFFNFEEGQYGKQAVVSSMEVVEEAATKPATAGGPATSYSNDRQNSIVCQSSRNDALEFAKLAQETGALVLPTSKANKLEALEAFVEMYTDKFAYAALNPTI